MKYTPEGALFWFACREDGRIQLNGNKIFIKNIPDKSYRGSTDQGFARLKEQMSYVPTLRELLCKETNAVEDPTYLNKPTYPCY